LFFPVLSQGFFCWDDQVVALGQLVSNFRLSSFPRLFTSFHAGLYHPLTTLTFIIDYHLGNGAPFPFHLTNLLIHLANIWLVLMLFSRLSGDRRITMLVTALFTLSPLQTEAIAWVTARKDLLSALFIFASLVTYIDFIKQGKKKFYILTLVFTILACLSKVQAVIIPLLLILAEYRFGRNPVSGRHAIRMVPVFIIVIFAGLMNLAAQRSYGYLDYNTHFSAAERLLNFTYGFSAYIAEILFPFHASVFYPFPFQHGGSFPLVTLASVAVFIAFLTLTLYLFTTGRREPVFGLLYFLVAVSVVLLVSNYREFIIAARYAYMTSTGLYLVIGYAAVQLIQWKPASKTFLYCFAGAYLLACVVMTVIQVRLWNDPLKLFESASGRYPRSSIILNTMGKLSIDKGETEKAVDYLARAVSADSTHAQAWYNKGVGEMKLNRFEAAMDDLSHAIRLNPSFSDAFFARGNLERVTKNYPDAFRDYSRVLEIDPANPAALNNRAIVRGEQGDFAGAVLDLNKAIEINPGLSSAWYLRGVAKFQLGINGCDDLQKALSLGYKDAQRALDYFCNRGLRVK
jgi:protein O-mannosyl-transferase